MSKNAGTILPMILLIIGLISLGVTASTPSATSTVPVANLQQPTYNPIISLNPSNISDTTLGKGSSFAFDVNITDAPPMSGFTVSLHWDGKLIDSSFANGVSVKGNIFQGQNANICVDGLPSSPPCPTQVPLGFATVTELLPQALQAPVSGLLFHITFAVNGAKPGFSQLQFLETFIYNSEVSIKPIPVTTIDGFFSNISCGGNPCTPPIPSITYSPTQPLQGRSVTFNGTGSVSTNPKGVIVDYSWSFDTTTYQSGSIAHENYNIPGPHTVTLTVRDNYTISWSKTITFTVKPFLWIDLQLSNIASSSNGVLAGTVVTLSTSAYNNSTRPENATIEASLEGQPLGTARTFVNLRPLDHSPPANFTWDTTGAGPKAYKITFQVLPVTNSTTGQIIENDTANGADANSQASTYVLIVYPQPAGGFSLLESAVLGGVVVGGAGALASRLRRPPKFED